MKVPVSVNVRFTTVSVDVTKESLLVEVILYFAPVESAEPFLNQEMEGRGRPEAVQVNWGDSPRRLTVSPGLVVICGLMFVGAMIKHATLIGFTIVEHDIMIV